MTACAHALSLINASPWGDARITSVRVSAGRIVGINEPPGAGDRVIDLQGDRLLPGLINAHDHLTLNTLPSLPPAPRYRHVREWIADANSHRRSDRQFAAGAELAREQRLFFGGLKNLLSGVTTVAHHDPLYPELLGEGFPTGVVSAYGWSHSLYLDGPESVQASWRATRGAVPWIIHAGEGVDDEAAAEFGQLETLGCVAGNTLLVHGIAFTEAQRQRLLAAGAGLIWCPASNQKLFGCTAQIDGLAREGHVALGTDSRLSGARDLLEELQVARAHTTLGDEALEGLVTHDAARLLRLDDRGRLAIGCRADLLVLPPHVSLCRISRGAIRLVIAGGVARLADPVYAARMAAPSHWADIELDGNHRLLHQELARVLAGAATAEPGLSLLSDRWRAA